MSRRRSSIFSFNTLQTGSIPAAWVGSIVIALTVLLGLEIAARVLLAPLGNHVWGYWSDEAANKFEWYRQEATIGQGFDVVVIGDSTGARNFSPEAFDAALPGVRSYNLAWPANFPLAMQATTVPLLADSRPPEFLILLQNPEAYADQPRVIEFEAGILSSPVGKRGQHQLVTADHLYLARLYRARHLLARHLRGTGETVSRPAHSGFMPLIPKAEGSPRATSLPEITAPMPHTTLRRETVLELARLATDRGMSLIVVLPPVNETPPPEDFRIHKVWLDTVADPYGFSVWDLSAPAELEDHHFFDKLHLYKDGALLFSRLMGERFQAFTQGSTRQTGPPPKR